MGASLAMILFGASNHNRHHHQNTRCLLCSQFKTFLYSLIHSTPRILDLSDLLFATLQLCSRPATITTKDISRCHGPPPAPTLPFQPKALAETIDESFTKPLPSINKKPGLGSKVTPSSTGTDATTPPKLWLDRDISDYTTPAEAALAKRQVQEVTIQHCMPTLESTHKIECEPDVVRPAALYLLHPVHMALKALHPSVSILCMSEPYDDGRKIRPDVVYKKGGEIFAILEYKVPGAVDKRQFQDAKVPWAASKEYTQNLISR